MSCGVSVVVVGLFLASSVMTLLSPCPCYVDTEEPGSVICDNTSLTFIPDCVAHSTTKLSIRTPSIALIPRNIHNFKDLRQLSLEYFKYPKLSKTFLSGQRDLIQFQISSTSLEYVDKDWFKYSQEIQTLDLSDNKIRSLAPETFRYLPQLVTVFLNGNPLATLPPSLFSGAGYYSQPTLETVYLHDNRWHCDSDMFSFMKWLTDHRVTVESPSYCAYPVELEGLNLKYLSDK